MNVSRRILLLGLGLLAPALALVHLACNADDESSGASDDVTDLGVCPSSYDAAAFAKYPLSSLPTGQGCTPNTDCYMPVDTCAADLASPGGGVDQTVYECDCFDAGWVCAATAPLPSCVEAGVADSGEDAPSGDSSADASDAAVD
jgi:hypothetical protein